MAARRSWIPLAAAALVAAGCVRLGVWQLERLAQRKARNAVIESAFRDAPTPLGTAGDSVRRFRRVIVSGLWDYGRETVLVGRTRNGAPGAHIVTPIIAADSDGRDILVNRGWVYSPDARTVDLTRWREGDRGEITGYVDELPAALRAGRSSLYVVALGDSSAPRADASRPARLSPPPFGESGPHLSYAVQWFSFAAIALIGTPILVRRQRRRR